MLPFKVSSPLLSRQLLLDPNVLFAGYRIPHPLQNRVEIRIQTDPLAQPFISPRKALLNACATLVNQGRDLRNSFKDQAQRLELQNRAMGATATVGQSRLGAMDGGYGGADVYGGDGGAGAYDSYMSGVGAGGAGASQQPSQAQDDPYGY